MTSTTMTHFRIGFLIAIFLTLGLVVPGETHAATSTTTFDVGGWIPYWRDSEGIKDARKNIKDLDTVFPFSYVITSDGGVKDLADMQSSEWKRFVTFAQEKNVKVIPTIMTSDGALLHTILSNEELRKKHITAIVDMVKKGKYDGVDIDYEGKKKETKDYFSLFLKELNAKLGKKILTCTIEARTPPESLYREVPTVINYANDFKAIAKYCDRVEIMAYDQQRADIKLNDARKGTPYVPVADPDWVEKVIKLALKDIPKEKIVLGVPTYGRLWLVTAAPEWYQSYQVVGAVNMPAIEKIAKQYNATSSRNSAGELSFTYAPTTTMFAIPSSIKAPKGTEPGNIAAARALAYATKTGKNIVFYLAWYSDAHAIEDKIDLAKEYGLKGIALFKIDGEEDKRIWSIIK